jgi:hypothetical protein
MAVSLQTRPNTATSARGLLAIIGAFYGKRREELHPSQEDTPAWYAATRARIEAKATLEQAEELRRVLEQLGEGLGR